VKILSLPFRVLFFITILFLLNSCATPNINRSNPVSIGQWLIKDSKKVYYIRVESTAKTFEQARQAGFKQAVSQAVGTLVVVETEVKNQQLIKQDIIHYSSGFIDDFKILDQTEVAGNVKIVMDVWVIESKIADRLLTVSKSMGTVEGLRAATQQQTYLDEQYKGDELLHLVTKDFPRNAFKVAVGKTSVTLEGRDSTLKVYVDFEWNEAYVNAIYDVLLKTREGTMGIGPFNLKKWATIIMVRRKDEWGGIFASYKDITKGNILYKNIVAVKPMLRLVIKDSENNLVFDRCFEDIHLSGRYFGDGLSWTTSGLDIYGNPRAQLYAAGTPTANIGIWGSYKANAILDLPLGRNTSALSKMKTTEVTVIKRNQCINY
jgi:hypothetical protein